MSVRAAAVASNRPSAASTSRSTVARRPSTQRSSSGRSATGGSSADGAQPKFAYCAKNAYTLRSVTRKFPADCRSAASSKRRGMLTWLADTRKSRAASAPWRSITSQGLTTFPLDFDILRPSASSTRSFTTTLRYGAAEASGLFGSASPSPVAIARSE
jgi:hypothetical protein